MATSMQTGKRKLEEVTDGAGEDELAMALMTPSRRGGNDDKTTAVAETLEVRLMNTALLNRTRETDC